MTRLRAAGVADRFGYTGPSRCNTARHALRRYERETGRGAPIAVVDDGRVHLEWDPDDVAAAVAARRGPGHPGGPRRAADRTEETT